MSRSDETRSIRRPRVLSRSSAARVDSSVRVPSALVLAVERFFLLRIGALLLGCRHGFVGLGRGCGRANAVAQSRPWIIRTPDSCPTLA